ncbi:carboxylesterase family protein [Escherichia coli]|nr:carboxylesterase family protein [Escherichia coli]
MQHPSKPLAKTRQGTLAGSAEQGIHIWRGIPYAAPPVGPPADRPPAGRQSAAAAADALTFVKRCAGAG